MQPFNQQHQNVWGIQQNAARDIINNIYPPDPWTPPFRLPPVASSFVGREIELTWLQQQLGGDDGKIVGLCGPGGMGKTALAARALKLLSTQEGWRERFPGGIFYHSFYSYPSL